MFYMMTFSEYEQYQALSMRLNGGVTLLYAIFECMEHNVFSSGFLAPAVQAVYEYLDNIHEEWNRQLTAQSPYKE